MVTSYCSLWSPSTSSLAARIQWVTGREGKRRPEKGISLGAFLLPQICSFGSKRTENIICNLTLNTNPSLGLSKTTVRYDSSYCEREAEGRHCTLLGSPGFGKNDSKMFYDGLKAFPLLCYIPHSPLQVCLGVCGSQPSPELFMQLHSRSTICCNLILLSISPERLACSFPRIHWGHDVVLRPAFLRDLPLTPLWLELHCVQFTVWQLTAHLNLCNVYQQHSLMPTYSSLSVNNTALYCCLHWDESSPLQRNSMETVLENSLSPHGVQKGTAGKRKSQMSLSLLTHLLPREPNWPNYLSCLGSGLLHIHCRDKTSQIINCCLATLAFLSYSCSVFSDGAKEINPKSLPYNEQVQRYSKLDVLTVRTWTHWQILKKVENWEPYQIPGGCSESISWKHQWKKVLSRNLVLEKIKICYRQKITETPSTIFCVFMNKK